jgi:hypothetical protein
MSRVRPGASKFFGRDWGQVVSKSSIVLTRLLYQYNFRMNALAGNLPGVKKASW